MVLVCQPYEPCFKLLSAVLDVLIKDRLLQRIHWVMLLKCGQNEVVGCPDIEVRLDTQRKSAEKGTVQKEDRMGACHSLDQNETVIVRNGFFRLNIPDVFPTGKCVVLIRVNPQTDP